MCKGLGTIHHTHIGPWFLLVVGILCAASAGAANLDVTVTDRDGRPLEYTAVMAQWPGAPAPVPGQPPAVMSQKDQTFVPHMLIVPTHSDVMFPNRDRTRHHVYSFSKTKTFDIKLYIGRPEAPIAFDKPGVVTLGCNIHDHMQAFIVVSDDPRRAVSDARGQAHLDNMPADAPVTLSIWHPWMHSEDTRATRVVAAGARAVTVELAVNPPQTPAPTRGSSLQDRFDQLAH